MTTNYWHPLRTKSIESIQSNRTTTGRLHDRLMRFANRPADEIIGGEDLPYLKRWHIVPRNRWLNVYLHPILRSDDDSALHDHSYMNLSILLSGRYFEHTIKSGGGYVKTLRSPGDIVFRWPSTAHRIEIPHNGQSQCWTLFLTGRRVREWGFHCPNRWIPWQEFTKQKDNEKDPSAPCADAAARSRR